MKWEDNAIVLSARAYGEKGALLCLLTRAHGREMGWFKGAPQKTGALIQPGTFVAAHWQARLSSQLGSWRLEALPQTTHLARILTDPLALNALLSAVSLVEAFLPEREVHTHVYGALARLMETLGFSQWESAYFDFECTLLAAAGFRLDLTRCAATGTTQNLYYVSPKTGRAVGKEPGAPYDARLLPLPSFLKDGANPSHKTLYEGLDLTQYFMERYILPHGTQNQLPVARARFRAQLNT